MKRVRLYFYKLDKTERPVMTAWVIRHQLATKDTVLYKELDRKLGINVINIADFSVTAKQYDQMLLKYPLRFRVIA